MLVKRSPGEYFVTQHYSRAIIVSYFSRQVEITRKVEVLVLGQVVLR